MGVLNRVAHFVSSHSQTGQMTAMKDVGGQTHDLRARIIVVGEHTAGFLDGDVDDAILLE